MKCLFPLIIYGGSMRLNWKEYVDRFRELIMNGWIIVRDGKTSIYWFINPNSISPRKYYFREAYALRLLETTEAYYVHTNGK